MAAVSRRLIPPTAAATVLALALAGCGEQAAPPHEGRPGGPYRMTLTTAPDPPAPGSPAVLTMRLRHAADGRPVTGLQVVHERVVHNFIVALDFTSFAHVHHEDHVALTAADLAAATFSFPHTFPRAGHYRVVSEFTHRDRAWTKHFDLAVGDAPPAPAPRVDLARHKHFGDIEAGLLSSPARPVAGFETELVLELARDGHPLTDLELLLGSEVHVATWRLDGRHFGHAHTYTPHMAAMMAQMHDRGVDAATRDARMRELMIEMIDMPAELVFPGPRVPVRHVFPAPGIYAVFFHCAPAGVARVFDFQLEVIAPGADADTHIESMVTPESHH